MAVEIFVLVCVSLGVLTGLCVLGIMISMGQGRVTEAAIKFLTWEVIALAAFVAYSTVNNVQIIY